MRVDSKLTGMSNDDGMLEDDEFRSRLKLLAGSNLPNKMRTVKDELITGTFPFLETRERKLLDWIIQTIWDMGVAPYDEIIIRLKLHDKKLFPSEKIINKSISGLCKSGILKCKVSEFRRIKGDRILSRKRVEVLELPEEFRDEALNGMAEVFKMTMVSYFSPQRKQRF